MAAADLRDIGARLERSVSAVAPLTDAATAAALRAAQPGASAALERYRAWLAASADGLGPDVIVGREAFTWYLRHVALVTHDPEELVRAAMQDYRRSVVAEAATRTRYREVPEAPLAASAAAESAAEAAAESAVRAFSEASGLLSQPDSLRHYRFAPTPAYLEPIAFLGVNDDLTSIRRVGDDATSYVPEPTADLPYFDAANARDPRLGIIHEGAHSQQLALSWAQPNPLRRHFIDSVANEGIAHYNEELMLTAGLFADAPHSQTIVHNFMRLRALRVVVDVNLATGVFSLPEAVDFFVRMVPMDVETATEETSYYVATPGLAMSYLVGKHEVMRLVADAAVAAALDGAEFSLRDVHDAVWRNGNVPMSLLRWELLGDRGDVDVLDAAGPWWEAPPGRSPTSPRREVSSAGVAVAVSVSAVVAVGCVGVAPCGGVGILLGLERRGFARADADAAGLAGDRPLLPESVLLRPCRPRSRRRRACRMHPSSSSPRLPFASRPTITHGGWIRRGVDTGGRATPSVRQRARVPRGIRVTDRGGARSELSERGFGCPDRRDHREDRHHRRNRAHRDEGHRAAHRPGTRGRGRIAEHGREHAHRRGRRRGARGRRRRDRRVELAVVRG